MKNKKSNAGKGKAVRVIVVVFLLLAVLAGAAAFLYNDYSSRVYSHCEVEAGTEILPEDFLKSDNYEIEYAEGSNIADTHVPGDQALSFKSGFYTYNVILTVVDTVAPIADAKDITIDSGMTVTPEQFVDNIVDETEVTVSFVAEPDLSAIGEQNVVVVLSDLGGNLTQYPVSLMINPVKTEMSLEAGSSVPKLSDVILVDSADAKLMVDEGINDSLSHVGDVKLCTRISGVDYYTTLHIVDTVAPALKVNNVSTFNSSPLTVEDFITEVYDVTDVQVFYDKDPDMELEGTQDLVVVAKDEGDNETRLNVQLTLVRDTEAPVITGTKDIKIYAGNSISYKSGVSVTDNADQDITFDVDASNVDVNNEGVYTARYIAVDRAGNRTVESITVTVEKCMYTESEIYSIADTILKTIIKDDMSDYDKIYAIFKWVHYKIAYSGHTDKGDWLKAAYEGMVDRSGDCYAYFATSKALLTRAGIPNRDIEKIPAKTMHYWNLVDIGEGWRHFDACPRKDRPNLFYLTDEELMEYSNSHNLSHNYDKTIYTDIS